MNLPDVSKCPECGGQYDGWKDIGFGTDDRGPFATFLYNSCGCGAWTCFVYTLDAIVTNDVVRWREFGDRADEIAKLQRERDGNPRRDEFGDPLPTAGWIVEDTGGGCEAFSRPVSGENGPYLYLTNEGAALPRIGERAFLGLYEEDGTAIAGVEIPRFEGLKSESLAALVADLVGCQKRVWMAQEMIAGDWQDLLPDAVRLDEATRYIAGLRDDPEWSRAVRVVRLNDDGVGISPRFEGGFS